MPTLDETTTDEDLRTYEFCVLYPSNLSQKEEKDLLAEVEKTIEEHGGKQVSKDLWGKRGLAYRIKGNDEGNFVVYHYALDPKGLKEIDVALRITPNLLRHIIVKPPKGYKIVKYSEGYETWLKEREGEGERKEKEKEEQLAKRVAEKAKRQVKRVAAKKDEEATVKKPKADKKQISEQLEKLISDDDLDI
ncbi:MAG: 30S ribosomal protein S6 [Candidatus Peribacter sp.]|jgi:small subunit ribosomal protein S6|nr:30S ribosomal protein S6 [Candidatus Peribacter sp.]MBT4393222.1 30S ribosomal protein S6 [Candidatus Peribacter sp.]MBT4601117.1 30S ribosomal protein S6 [Candidatus Peribacter sp.]MBT5148923.1 30S ribosomal protein S6 [Candidatus Peribacter sp.]MBT5637198.1 30S ribosomal protein S6 [Candidatus Peribacter sp.]